MQHFFRPYLVSLFSFVVVCGWGVPVFSQHAKRANRAGVVSPLAPQAEEKADPVSPSSPIPADVPEHFLAAELAPHVLVDPEHFCWGMSVIRWSDGKYHGYYARWPKKTGGAGWMTHCEIAHAVSDRPEGPFKTVGVAIQSRHLDGWDRVNAHNPYVCVAEGKIHLYYIANRLEDDFKPTPEAPFPSDAWMKKNRLNIVRNRQCVGVATAESPDGPFVRAPRPVIVPDGQRFKNIAVNPAVIYHDGQFIMIVKGDDPNKRKWFRIQLVAHADRAEGPFHFEDRPIYDKAQTEDACLWYDTTEKKFHCLIHVAGQPYLAHLVSDDSHHWQEAKPFFFMRKEFLLDNGTIWKPNRVERPFVLTNAKGQPEWLYCAVAVGKRWGNVASRYRSEEPSSEEESGSKHRHAPKGKQKKR